MVWRSLSADDDMTATRRRYDRGISDVATRAEPDRFVLLERLRSYVDESRMPYFLPPARTAWRKPLNDLK